MLDFAHSEVFHVRPTKPYAVFDTLVTAFSDWLEHRRELNELRQLNTAEFDRIASELRVSPSDLSQLVRQGPHAGDELPQMLKALGIDEEGPFAHAAPGAA